MSKKKSVIVIGAGPAGYVCAIRLAQLGKKVTIIDKDEFGGVCLNRGCIPSKALITAANFYEKCSHAEYMGIEITGAKVNFPKLMQWKNTVVQQLTKGVEGLLRSHQVEMLKGEAILLGANTLQFTPQQDPSHPETFSFEHAVLATGSHPISLPFLSIDQKMVLDSTGALAAQTQPASLICIGGGYIGLELGIFYAKLGTKVQIVEAGPTLLSTVDPDLIQVLTKRMKKLDITIHMNTRCEDLKLQKNICSLGVTQLGKKLTLEAEKILVTVGRKPNSRGLGLEHTQVQVDEQGFIKVEKNFQTHEPSIYAIGDIVGQPMLAHKASAEGMIAAASIAGEDIHWDHHVIPAVIFTDPEIASVGLTEKEAKEKNITIKVDTFPFAANGRALTLNETDGFIKLISNPSGKLLGMHIIGPEASQLISEGALAIEMGAYVDDLGLTIHPHPTLSETIMEAAHVALGHGIHIYKPKKSSS